MSNPFEVRVNSARKQYMNMDGSLWENLERLWDYGYSLRVISEVSNISRSTLQRHFSENNIGRDDEIGTQNRDLMVKQTLILFNSGLNRQQIANKLGLNVRTIDSYLKQLRNRGAI